MHTEAGAPELAMVSVTDATEQVQTQKRLEAIQAEQTQLVSELSTTNRRLSDLNKKLQDANEELQAANEELMLTQEELQATNEEFEATNEELQATNEELQTTNDELTARTQELQEMARDVERGQSRLLRMVEYAPFNVLVLAGPALVVESYSPGYARLFGGSEVAGRPFEEVFRGAGVDGFVEAVKEAYAQNQTVTTPPTPIPTGEAGGDPAKRHFVHTIVPVQDGDTQAGGVIVYSEDSTGRGEDGS